jgi:L-asparaginase/Glu-tRNA(Gln) amidotransferase subunit D
MKRITCLFLSLAAALAAAASAAATPPTHDETVVIPYAFSVDCGPYGFAFSNVVEGTQTDRVQTFYDANGTPVKVVDHGQFTETDTNSVTRKVLGFSQSWIQTFDLVAGTRTVVGKEFVMTDAGKGIVIHDTGRTVFDAPDHVVFDAGHHQVLFGNIDELACTALSA